MSHFLIEKKKRDLAIQILAAFVFSVFFQLEIHSEVKVPSFEKLGRCKITRNSDLCSATLQNKSLNVIFVDGTDVPSEDTIMIRCGSEIILGPVSDGYLSYRFKVMPMNESSKKVLQAKEER
ncbi:putative forkhead-associated (FHA) domain, SMAD/FHA domain superfamily [Helianthus annuus]|nr:putative forkhead-associated (FHA) domain, SMAD/FHA domain superfamily [Helianthus annuus]KAJ0848865.1 putative forkhead-associated (FHA) domain, SMAD/FHA domain superfamily [Helianthus annuus]